MKKLVYSLEQMEEMSRVINSLHITGIEQAKLVTYAAAIIDSPLKSIDEPMEGIDYEEPKEEVKGE